MAYNPYNDITALTGKAKSAAVSAKDVYDLVTEAGSFYKSTYGKVRDEAEATKDYIEKGTAYKDAGAQAIRAAYADYADREQGHTAAETAGENSGNLNSYAAAQANRAAAAMLSAGEEAVKERAQTLTEGLLAADKNLLSAAEGAADALSGGADTAAELAKISADERKSALGALLDLYGVLNK